jgi:hypothetical protein
MDDGNRRYRHNTRSNKRIHIHQKTSYKSNKNKLNRRKEQLYINGIETNKDLIKLKV